MDSGATSVGIFIKSAGKQLIHIIDNGNGMSKEDLELSIMRHATSKIITQEDLETIKTFGFRGEALASIAAVAEIDIISKLIGEKIGYKLSSIPNKNIEIEPYNLNDGTQIFVKNLFYNVPARKKFLKSNLTEFRHISETVIKFAISNPKVRFTFYDDDTLIFDLKPSNLITRIINLIGNIQINQLMEINHVIETDSLKVYGYIGKPNIAKNTRGNQFIFLNGRNIISKSINHSIYSSFEHLLDKSAHPFFSIFIELDYKKVDVNVHPQKHEVKFEDERKIYNFIRDAIQQTLNSNNLTFELNINQNLMQAPFEVIDSQNEKVIINRFTGEVIENDFSNFNQNKQFNGNKFTNERNSRYLGNNTFNKDCNNNFQSAFDLIYDKNNSIPTDNINQNENLDIFNSLDLFSFVDSNHNEKVFNIDNLESKFSNYIDFNNLHLILIHKKYILLETRYGLLVVDMHNAHERIIYENVIEKFNQNALTSQQLLFPEEIVLDVNELKILDEVFEELQFLGYSLKLDNNTLTIYAVPSDLSSGESNFSINEILSKYEEFQQIRHTDKRDNIAATIACKSAVKTGYSVSIDQIKAIIIDLFKCQIPYVCPHGRPVILDISLKSLDLKFKRT